MNSKLLIKKTGALVLIGAMFFSLCACSMFSKKDVLAAAKEVADNIENFDADRLLSLSTLSSGSDKADDLRKGLNGDYLDENTLKFCTAVRKTITSRVLEDTFTAKGKEASVDIEFKIADYKSVLKKDYKNIDELVSAVRNCDDTITVTYAAKFVKEDGEWLLDNLMGSSFLAIFEFMDADIGALAVDLSKVVKGSGWGDAPSDGYQNTKKLILKVAFESDITKLAGKGVKMTYTVEKDGKKVWTSDAIELGNETEIQLDYGTDQNPGAEVKSGYLAAGKYKFTLTADNGTVMHTAEVEVKLTIKETTTSTASKGYKFYDNNFASKVLKAGWTNVDSKLVSAASYGSDAWRISFQMQVDPSTTEKLYYAYFYSANVADALKINVRKDTPVISGYIEPMVEGNGTYYAMGVKTKSGNTMKQGLWILAIFSEDKQTIYGLADCQVLSKPASDYK